MTVDLALDTDTDDHDVCTYCYLTDGLHDPKCKRPKAKSLPRIDAVGRCVECGYKVSRDGLCACSKPKGGKK